MTMPLQLLFGLCVALSLATIHQCSAKQRAQYKQAVAEKALAVNAANAAAARAAFAEDARKREQALRQDINDLDQAWRWRVEDANAEAARTTADLIAGNRRLREHWRACTAAAATVPGAGAAAGGADAAARLQAESVGRIDGAVAACDAHVIALQDVVRAYLKAGGQ